MWWLLDSVCTHFLNVLADSRGKLFGHNYFRFLMPESWTWWLSLFDIRKNLTGKGADVGRPASWMHINENAIKIWCVCRFVVNAYTNSNELMLNVERYIYRICNWTQKES
jgi:hypothetical protein